MIGLGGGIRFNSVLLVQKRDFCPSSEAYYLYLNVFYVALQDQTLCLPSRNSFKARKLLAKLLTPLHPPLFSTHRLPICSLCVCYSSKIHAPSPRPTLIKPTLGHLSEDVYPGSKYVRGNIILVLSYLSSA